jgi:hypothetical protein
MEKSVFMIHDAPASLSTADNPPVQNAIVRNQNM